MTTVYIICAVRTAPVLAINFLLTMAESTSLAEPTGELSGAVFCRRQKITPSGFGGYPPNRFLLQLIDKQTAVTTRFPASNNLRAEMRRMVWS